LVNALLDEYGPLSSSKDRFALEAGGASRRLAEGGRISRGIAEGRVQTGGFETSDRDAKCRLAILRLYCGSAAEYFYLILLAIWLLAFQMETGIGSNEAQVAK
jgi:hypothetical protein